MIAIFVLLMQILWLYIDDIAGKGLGIFILIELLAYKCVALIPMALPLAMLISSVMVLGNMAEHYELSSFKSAGVPLLRVMKPLMFFGVATTAFSYFCSNNLIPIANLKFGSRMYDIQRQKPALRLDAGVFNDDFEGYAIHIGNKSSDNKGIQEVLIYDHTEANRGRLSQIVAEEGEMYQAGDGKYFIMNLKNGNQYVETKPSGTGTNKNYPFIRTSFKNWNKIFDCSEFELNRTNEELFKQNRSMLSTAQLRVAIDSIGWKILRRQKSLANQVSAYFHYIERDSTFIEEEQEKMQKRNEEMEKDMAHMVDSTALPAKLREERGKKPKASNQSIQKPNKVKVAKKKLNKSPKKKTVTPKKKPNNKKKSNIVAQKFEGDVADMESIIKTFPIYEQRRLYEKAKSFARSIHSQAQSAARSYDRMAESKVKHIYDLHTKYSMAVICSIFLFIGAPMGAIVRKGGFGYPILIAILFFMLFVVLTIFCRKIAESFVLPAEMAAWVPCSVLFPIGVLLTYKAMNDSKLLNLDRYTAFISKLLKKKEDQ